MDECQSRIRNEKIHNKQDVTPLSFPERHGNSQVIKKRNLWITSIAFLKGNSLKRIIMVIVMMIIIMMVMTVTATITFVSSSANNVNIVPRTTIKIKVRIHVVCAHGIQ